MGVEKNEVLYIVIPAYNEEENIETVIRDWYPVVERYSAEGQSRLVIIDDGSKDNTYQLMLDMKATDEYPLLIALTKPNGGHGATVLYGYHYAIDQKADYIFQTDSDGQTIPNEFDAFWEKRADWDMIIGHRNHREDGISRIFVTKTLKLVLFLCFGVGVTDANTPFRLMRADTLKRYVGLIPEGFNLSNVLVSVIYAKKGLRVKYMPITFRPRQGGVNSINIPKIVRIGWKAVGDFWKFRKELSK